jgi:DNA primase
VIPQTFIQELLARADIVEVIDRHVRLKRAGANFVACCPFHSEKSPSFTVSQVKQFYHCFGCGAHGTAIGFLMEYSGMGYVEAIKDLAQSLGMTVPEEQRSEHSQKRLDESQDLHGVLLTAARYFRSCLKDAAGAIEYLKHRGLSGEIAREFGIGYAPDGWQNLAAAFPDYESKTLVVAGLVKQNEGKRYDLFRNRIMFPIVDVRGNVIGFGGRVLDASEPKYLNSPETPVFEKGRELYGLYQARRAIRDAGRVLVVEGYMDVVALAQHGVGYAVATLGTATSPLHMQKLLRQVDEVVFCFDGDQAGRRAAWRGLEVSLPELADGKQVRFLFLPQGEDPDSYVRAHGKEAFEALIDVALPLSRYLLEELASQVDLSSAEGRSALVHLAKPLLAKLAPTTFRVQILRELADRSRLSLDELEALCGFAKTVRRAVLPAKTVARAGPELWRKLLRLLLDAPQFAELVTTEQRRLLERDPEYAPVVALIDAIREGGITTMHVLLEVTRDSKYAGLYGEIAKSLGTPALPEEYRGDFDGIFAHLEQRSVELEYEQLLGKLSQTEGERRRFDELTRRLAELKGVVRSV